MNICPKCKTEMSERVEKDLQLGVMSWFLYCPNCDEKIYKKTRQMRIK